MRRSRLEQLAARGHRRARLALGISLRLDAYLSASQLGITLASLALGWLGEPAFAALLEPLLARLGPWSAATAHAVAVAAGLAAITFLHTVLGELVPKSLAIRRTEPVALWTAAPLRLFYVAMFPIIWALNAVSWLVLRAFGVRRTGEVEALHSPEELRLLLQHVELEPDSRRVIDRLLDDAHPTARQAMTPRREVVALDAGRPWEESLAVAVARRHTRYPVVEGEGDRVLGYVHIKDIAAALASGRRPDSVRELLREPIYAPEAAPLEQLRRELLLRHGHLAVITGARQAFAGIVTLDDLLGEVADESQGERDTDDAPGSARPPLTLGAPGPPEPVVARALPAPPRSGPRPDRAGRLRHQRELLRQADRGGEAFEGQLRAPQLAGA
ncbi:MAG TPA: hemolysin family protein, partial [Polyangiaceae bacterium]|nr:hemolysin family protein [Polyangiaceae bacterium]